ncbi:MAG: hypothetical protein H6550_01000 [Chitinophagales bacterium]|nr:hypothetical protein [Chitinophagales bacterium]
MTMYILLGIAVYVTVQVLFRKSKKFTFVQSRWQHIFDGLKFSSDDFYKSVQELVNSKEMPDVSISKIKFDQTTIYDVDRVYLRIRRDDSMFLVCAAPFGTGFFISWWYGQPVDWFKEMWLVIPILGWVLRNTIYTQTFYKLDVDGMFSETVKQCVKEAIENMTSAKGTRNLTEQEYKETMLTQLSVQ